MADRYKKHSFFRKEAEYIIQKSFHRSSVLKNGQCSKQVNSTEKNCTLNLHAGSSTQLLQEHHVENSASVRNFAPDSNQRNLIQKIELSSDSSDTIISDGFMREKEKTSSLESKLASWVVKSKCPAFYVNDLLHILNPYFPELPLDCRKLLGTPRKNCIFNMLDGQYLHVGVKVSLTNLCKSSKTNFSDCINIDVGIDGVGISSSLTSTIWPILISLVDNPEVELVGTYFGNSKPKDINVFLEPFVQEMRLIFEGGFNWMGKVYNVKIRTIICDAPARAFVLNVTTFSGYNSCSKCEIRGFYVLNRVTFPFGNYQMRTDLSFKNKTDGHYHLNKNTTMIENLGISCVSQVPVDYMHCVCLGVMKQLMSLWKEQRMRLYSLPNNIIAKVSADLIHISKQMPSEFSRSPRPLSLFRRYKATEFRQLLLYTLPILLKDKIKGVYYRHFLKLHCAVKILCSSKDYMINNHLSEKLLKDFVQDFGTLYGIHTMSFNVHSLLHLSKYAREIGACLESFSAFKFENYLQYLKKLSRSGNKVLAQIHNRLEERNHAEIKKDHNTPRVLVTTEIQMEPLCL